MQGDYVYCKYYTEVLFVEMYLNVVFVVLFVSAMSLTRDRDWRFIRTIIIIIILYVIFFGYQRPCVRSESDENGACSTGLDGGIMVCLFP